MCGGAEKRSIIFVTIVISLSLYTNFGEDIALYRSWEALEHKLNVLSWMDLFCSPKLTFHRRISILDFGNVICICEQSFTSAMITMDNGSKLYLWHRYTFSL